MKPFLTNKGFIANSDIYLKEGENFNDHYVNIIKKTTASKPDTDLHKFWDMDINSARISIKKFKKNSIQYSNVSQKSKVNLSLVVPISFPK